MNKEEYNKLINLHHEKEISKEDFESRIIEITKTLEFPLREFYIINSYLYDYYAVPKDKRNFLYAYSLDILESNKISLDDKNKIKCALINAYTSDYNYLMAEFYAKDLLNEFKNDVRVLRELANYYTKTRRYELAKTLYEFIINLNGYDLIAKNYEILKKIINNERNPYLPATRENKEKYFNFMEYLNISIDSNLGKKRPSKIKVEDYPLPKEHIQADFDSFVAFDIETTGINYLWDSITEIAAIKVVNGEIKEEKEFLFQQLVHPYKKRIPKVVENLTGITNEMVKDAKNIWEVFPEFVDFIGDNILLGYNCMAFDSKFLIRAGRLSNIIIENEYFDVLHMARRYKDIIMSKNMTLIQVGKALEIENPRAHRALSDAITTAKVYLALK